MALDDLHERGEHLGRAGDDVAGGEVVVSTGQIARLPPASLISRLPAAMSAGQAEFPEGIETAGGRRARSSDAAPGGAGRRVWVVLKMAR